MEAFHSGKASTLVATDIAARGIHVDDVALVIHADPPAEHKAYLHRSGRTARAGAAGTVITLMTDQQVSDVRALTRDAKIHPTTTRISGPDHAMLEQLAPGERVLVAGGLVDDRPAQPASRGGGGGGNGRRRGGGGGRPQGGGGGPRSSNGRSQGQSRGGTGWRPEWPFVLASRWCRLELHGWQPQRCQLQQPSRRPLTFRVRGTLGAMEVLTPRDVPFGGLRAMTVRRTLPQRQRSLTVAGASWTTTVPTRSTPRAGWWCLRTRTRGCGRVSAGCSGARSSTGTLPGITRWCGRGSAT